MREYLFRGKRVDNGEWVEGYYLVAAGMPFIFVFAVREPISVFPETVGQYIAKHKIFTGDICEISNGDEVMYKGTISWCEDCMSYLLTDAFVLWKEGFIRCEDSYLEDFVEEFWQFKVVGTVYDKEETQND